MLYFEINLLLTYQTVEPVINFVQNETMTLAEFDQKVSAGAQLVLLEGMVLDVKDFLQFHPGGQFVINKRIGYDVTNLFNGSPYSGNTEEGANEMGHMHSNQARLLASSLAFAKISNDAEINESGDTIITNLLRKIQKFQDFASYSYPPDMVRVYQVEDFMVISELRPTIKDISLHIKHL